MRLAFKLALGLMLGIAAVLAVQSVVHIRRVLEVHEQETRDDLALLAWSVSDATAELWLRAGPEEAARYVARASSRRPDVRFRLTDVSEADRAAAPRTLETLDHLAGDVLIMRVPVIGQGAKLATLELRHTAPWAQDFIEEVVRSQLITVGGLVLVSGLLSLLFGVVFVGRRAERLIEQTREVVRGRFVQTGDRQRDELGRLARELNLMVQHLASARLRVQAEKRRRTELLERLRHADRLSTVGKLSSAMAHELGTPLNVVGGRAALIQMEDGVSDEVRHNARIIQEQADRMAGIIRELLDYARSRTLQRRRVPLGDLLEEARSLLEPLAEESGVHLVVAETPDEPAHVDAGKVLQVITNLITNAIQAMPEGGTVTLSAHSEHVSEPPDARAAPGEFHCIVVEDDGPGIPPPALDRVFKPFFTTKREGEGTGLGLSVCQEIVKEHGGWIQVESEPSRGSRFTVHLPRGES